jgi:hypothetical protein
MDIDDKVCEQVSMTLLKEVSPKEVIEQCLEHSQPWASKQRRVRGSTGLALVLFVIALALWSRLNPCQVWHKLVGKRERSAPSRAGKRAERFRALETAQGTR